MAQFISCKFLIYFWHRKHIDYLTPIVRWPRVYLFPTINLLEKIYIENIGKYDGKSREKYTLKVDVPLESTNIIIIP